MNDDFYQLALSAVKHHLNEAGLPYEMDDGEILLDGHRLGLSVGFEEFVTQADQVIAPLDMHIHLDSDNGDRFRVGTLGIGSDRTSAMQAAVAEWHLLAASPVLAALGAAIETRRKQRHPPELAGWALFPGRAGIRGRMPAELEAGGAFYRDLLAALKTVIASWDTPARLELRSIYLMAACDGPPHEVQAAIDGIVDAELCKTLSELPWPTAGQAYLYKQLFVLRGGSQ